MTALHPAASAAVSHLRESKAEAMHGVLRRAKFVAGMAVPVFLEGETGTGKEVLATLIHETSPRAQKKFIAVNCAAIPAELAEAEFFGHKRGAFTGAASQRDGYFRAAHEGTLFLDEVGELPLALQAKLLRALNEKKIVPVGSDEEIQVNVRIISATNRDLAAMVSEGKFREDLYHRLNVVSLRMPPLRDRPEDIPSLANFFLAKHGKENDFPNDLKLSKAAMIELQKYSWPGNIRQLSNVVVSSSINALSLERAVIEAEDVTLPKEQKAAAAEVKNSPVIAGAPILFSGRAPVVIASRLLPDPEMALLALESASARVAFATACKVLGKPALAAYANVIMRHAIHKLSPEGFAQQQNISLPEVRLSLKQARNDLIRALQEDGHADIVQGPIVRKREYQGPDEDYAAFHYFTDREVTPELEGQLQAASLLLNRKAYHEIGWWLTSGDDGRGRKASFDATPQLSASVAYLGLKESFKRFGSMMGVLRKTDAVYADDNRFTKESLFPHQG